MTSNTEKKRSKVRYRFSDERNVPGRITLYEELRLIERNEGEINVIWKGAHMTLFFMAFVFGSFCTCCFHLLMHMFDGKCVLFPKVISHSSITSIVREFFSIKMEPNTEVQRDHPFDYVSTQWAENSVCYLPTYVPLVSGLAGLVWTTMCFMCSSGTSNITGAQRHWRALPLMFVFSVAMAGLCIYASAVTHSGLRELCKQLSEVTGGNQQFIYTINVATLAYEHRIRGVYQATRLSIASAWLHTTCWILSALLVVARVLLAVDFTLVLVRAQLIGDLDDMLQKYEYQIDNISADFPGTPRSGVHEDDSEVELFAIANVTKRHKSQIQFKMPARDTLDESTEKKELSGYSLVPEEEEKLGHYFITKLVNDLVNNIGKPESRSSSARLSRSSSDTITPGPTQSKMHMDANSNDPKQLVDAEKAEKVAKEFMQKLHGQLAEEFKEFEQVVKSNLKLESIYDAEKRRPRLHSSDDDEDTKTHDVQKRTGIKIENLYGTKKDKQQKHISIRTSDEKDEKFADKNKSELAASGRDKPENILESDTKAGYSGFKRTQKKYEYEPDDNEIYKENRKIDKIEKKLVINYVEKTKGTETTPSSITEDSDIDDKVAHEKEKTGEGPVKEEKDENVEGGNDETDDVGKRSDNRDRYQR